MRNRFILALLSVITIAPKIFADTTSVAVDSIPKPFSPPNQGPLGIDNITGVALFEAMILFALLVIALWRMNILKRRGTNG
jgi:hypothetical protein